MSGTTARSGNGTGAKPVKAYKGAVSGVRSASNRAAEMWALTDAGALLDAVAAVTAIGAGLLVGATQDGGTLAVTLFHENDRVRFYPASLDDLHDLLRDMVVWSKHDKPRLAFWR